MMKNEPLRNGLSPRFYSDAFPEQWRHPFFLLSAAAMKFTNMRHDMGMDKIKIIGDSGGFQLAMGTWKWDSSLNEKVILWLENNSDVAMALDIPPRVKFQAKFKEALDLSYANFKYFADHQSGKCDFLNVLHGSNEEEYLHWYEKVKDFDFTGYAIGGAIGNIIRVIYVIALLIEKGELDKPHNKYIHVLGVSSGTDFLILSSLQKFLNDRFNGKIQLSTDSSSPSRITGFGSGYFGINWRTLVWTQMPINKHLKDKLDMTQSTLCGIPGCPACKGLTYGDLYNFDSSSYSSVVLHNLFVYTNMLDTMAQIVECPQEISASIISPDAAKTINIIKEIIMSDSPVNAYSRHRNFLLKFGSMNDEKYSSETINQFFDFK